MNLVSKLMQRLKELLKKLKPGNRRSKKQMQL